MCLTFILHVSLVNSKMTFPATATKVERFRGCSDRMAESWTFALNHQSGFEGERTSLAIALLPAGLATGTWKGRSGKAS